MVEEKLLHLGASAIREIFEYGNRRKAEIGAENVFDFSLGNPSIPAPDAVRKNLLKLVSETDPVALHAYTSAVGDASVRAAIADHINRLYHAGADPKHIYMTCGAAASLTISLHALTEPEDEVIALAPFFPEYRVFSEKAGAKFVTVPCRESDFQIDFEALEKAVNAHTKAIIVNSPNNPTGVVLSEKTIAQLAELLQKKEAEYRREIFILADEPYRELAYDADVPYIPNFYAHTIVCYSYSKSLSLPGERIGYIYVSSKMPEADIVYRAVCGAGRLLGFVCAPSLQQYLVRECVDEPADIAAYRRNRDLLYTNLCEMGYQCARPDGAFYLFVKSLEPDAVAFCERAKDFELLLVPSDSFGMTGYIRIAYCVSEDQIRRSLPAFRQLMDAYKK